MSSIISPPNGVKVPTIDDLTAVISAVNDIRASLDAAKSVSDSILATVSDLQKASGDFESRTALLESTVHTNTDSISGLSVQMDTVKGQVKTIQDKIATTAQDLSELSAKLTTLQSVQGSQTSQITDLVSQLQSAVSQIKSLQSALTVTNTAVSGVQSTIASNQNGLANLQTTVNGIQAEMTTISARVTKIEQSGSTGTTTPTGPTTTPTPVKTASKLHVPLYAWPVKFVAGKRVLSDAWQAIVDLKTANKTLGILVTFNPDNGNFNAGENLLSPNQEAAVVANPDHAWALDQLKAAGIEIQGYVSTQYTARDAEICKQRLRIYTRIYPQVQGPMFDEMSTDPTKIAWYKALGDYAKSLGHKFTVGNPGTAVPKAFIGALDMLKIYENKATPTADQIKSACNGLDKNNFGVTIYAQTAYSSALILAIKDMVGFVYVTQAPVPPSTNPYDVASSYLGQLAKDLLTVAA